MGIKGIIGMGGICAVFAVVSLFLVGGEASGQCTPGQRFHAPFVPGDIEQPWSGSQVPLSVLPNGFPGGPGNPYYTGWYYSWVADFCGVPGFGGCYLPTWQDGRWTGGYGNPWNFYLCWTGSCVMYRYWETPGSDTLDYDCDGIVDVADNHPAEPDGKGVNAGNPGCMSAVAK